MATSTATQWISDHHFEMASIADQKIKSLADICASHFDWLSKYLDDVQSGQKSIKLNQILSTPGGHFKRPFDYEKLKGSNIGNLLVSNRQTELPMKKQRVDDMNAAEVASYHQNQNSSRFNEESDDMEIVQSQEPMQLLSQSKQENAGQRSSFERPNSLDNAVVPPTPSQAVSGIRALKVPKIHIPVLRADDETSTSKNPKTRLPNVFAKPVPTATAESQLGRKDLSSVSGSEKELKRGSSSEDALQTKKIKVESTNDPPREIKSQPQPQWSAAEVRAEPEGVKLEEAIPPQQKLQNDIKPQLQRMKDRMESLSRRYNSSARSLESASTAFDMARPSSAKSSSIFNDDTDSNASFRQSHIEGSARLTGIGHDLSPIVEKYNEPSMALYDTPELPDYKEEEQVSQKKPSEVACDEQVETFVTPETSPRASFSGSGAVVEPASEIVPPTPSQGKNAPSLVDAPLVSSEPVVNQTAEDAASSKDSSMTLEENTVIHSSEPMSESVSTGLLLEVPETLGDDAIEEEAAAIQPVHTLSSIPILSIKQEPPAVPRFSHSKEIPAISSFDPPTSKAKTTVKLKETLSKPVMNTKANLPSKLAKTNIPSKTAPKEVGKHSAMPSIPRLVVAPIEKTKSEQSDMELFSQESKTAKSEVSKASTKPSFIVPVVTKHSVVEPPGIAKHGQETGQASQLKKGAPATANNNLSKPPTTIAPVKKLEPTESSLAMPVAREPANTNTKTHTNTGAIPKIEPTPIIVALSVINNPILPDMDQGKFAQSSSKKRSKGSGGEVKTIVDEHGELPEISSDYSDDEEDEESEPSPHASPPPKPAVPVWASTPKLKEALANQVTNDPDKIFGAVKPLQLEEVFKGGRIKRKFRDSCAGNWTHKDALTAEEEEEYKREMGFQ